MSDKSAIYQFFSDNVTPNATLSIQTGTDLADQNYAAEILANGDPGQVAKIGSLTGAWMAEFSSAQPVTNVMLIHHNFAAGTSVKLQGHATDSWGAPSFSMDIIVPSWRGSGDRAWPVNPWGDLTTAVGYNAAGFKFWRLLITSNTQNLELGLWLLHSQTRRFTEDLAWSSRPTMRKRSIENRSAGGVPIIQTRGTNEVIIEGDHLVKTVLHDELVEQWYDVDGRYLSWGFVPYGDRNACYYGRWGFNDRQDEWFAPDGFRNHFVFEETNRGLRPGV